MGHTPASRLCSKRHNSPGSWEAALPARGSRLIVQDPGRWLTLLAFTGQLVCSSRLVIYSGPSLLTRHSFLHPFTIPSGSMTYHFTQPCRRPSPTQSLFPSPTHLFAQQPSSLSLKGPNYSLTQSLSFLSVCVCVHTPCMCRCPRRPEVIIGFPGTGIPGGCEPPSVDVGN